jgi:hypothetical protein
MDPISVDFHPEDGARMMRNRPGKFITAAALTFIAAVTPRETMAQSASTRYLSDTAWTSATNGWGPVEKNMSNGEASAGDGRTITLNGKTYSKGLGVHANSEVRFSLGGSCSTFTSAVGIDDEVGASGSVVFQVWADGTKLYDSGVVNGNSATQQVNVNVSGKNQISLVATDGGNGNGYDHADWADAQLTCTDTAAPGARYLSDMLWTSAQNGWGPVEKDKSNGEINAGDGHTITLNGKTYAKGLGVHASSEVRFNLGGSCSAFTSDLGVDDEVGSNGSVVFQVWGDGLKLYDSGMLYGYSTTQQANVDITGKNQLSLVVTDGGNGNGSDHADWANAQVTCSGSGTAAPYVSTVNPADGATNVAGSTTFSATFSQAMDSATVTPSSLILTKQGSTTPLPATVTYDPASTTATLRPSTSLDAAASYIATVKAGVRSLGGMALATDRAWTVSTSSTSQQTPSGPLVIDGKQNVVISGVSITNPNGHCIEIKGNAQNITIQNSTLGPCAGGGVSISSAANVTIQGVYIHDTTDNGIIAYSVNGINITDNRIENIKSGVYALQSSKVNIAFNTFKNVRGPFPRGQFVQFDKVKGPGNRIKCNVGENVMGESYPEDAINMYQSDGDPADPIQIIGNKIKGGGPSKSGGGIMMGDSGGSYQTVQDNILVDPGQYGLSIASGHDMKMINNSVYARQQSFTNVGVSVWNQYPPACYGNTVQGNTANYTNSSGAQNASWNAGNCGTVTGWSSNTWGSSIGPSIFDQPIAACKR